MTLVASSQPNKVLKLFSSKLYKIRAQTLDFLVQNLGPFTTPTSIISLFDIPVPYTQCLAELLLDWLQIAGH